MEVGQVALFLPSSSVCLNLSQAADLPSPHVRASYWPICHWALPSFGLLIDPLNSISMPLTMPTVLVIHSQ